MQAAVLLLIDLECLIGLNCCLLPAAQAYQTRFPYNARVPIMMKSELLEEKKSEDGTKETKVRRCTLKIDAPYLMRKVRW